MKIVVTGGAGFIGSAVVRHLVAYSDHEVLVVDKLTYAGNLASLNSVQDNARYHFSQSDICDRSAIRKVFADFNPDAVMHLAAESHVDRSIDGPAEFINTNVIGTYVLLEAALAYWQKLGTQGKASDSCTFRLTRCTARSGMMGGLRRKAAMIRARPIRPVRRPRTIW